MRISLIVVAILSVLFSSDMDQRNEVICFVEISVVKSKKIGQLMSVVGKLENGTSQKS